MELQLQSPLFARFPYEVRERVFAHLLAFRHGDFEYTLQPGDVFLYKTHVKPLPPAMLACKRLYRELAPAVHHGAALRTCMFASGSRVGFAVHGTLRVERLHTLHLLVAMEHSNWNAWLRFLREVLARAGALRELLVDWEPRRVLTTSGRGKKGWMAGHEGRMEEQFFGVIAGLEELELVRLYGERVPDHWKGRLEELTNARIIHSRVSWWREDAGDTWFARSDRGVSYASRV